MLIVIGLFAPYSVVAITSPPDVDNDQPRIIQNNPKVVSRGQKNCKSSDHPIFFIMGWVFDVKDFKGTAMQNISGQGIYTVRSIGCNKSIQPWSNAPGKYWNVGLSENGGYPQ